MTTADIFKRFRDNLAINDTLASDVSHKYHTITKLLNQNFRNSSSEVDNSLIYGSYGRHTAVNKGVSDLDMLYIVPKSLYGIYKDSPKNLLTRVKDTLKTTYPSSNIVISRHVVMVRFKTFTFEILPVFDEGNNIFKFPDTYAGGKWKKTMPRKDLNAMKDFCKENGSCLRHLCKMIRAWKNTNGVAMNGLLIDTLAYNFLSSSNKYKNATYSSYDNLILDFFEFLKNQPINKEYYHTLGSQQRVYIARGFQYKAKKAYEECKKALESEREKDKFTSWKKVFGKAFPSIEIKFATLEAYSSYTSRNTEQFIEDLYTVDIQYNISIDCNVSKKNFLTYPIKRWIEKFNWIRAKSSLEFTCYVNKIPESVEYELFWKVLNRGEEAFQRNCIRGQIFPNGPKHIEPAAFIGDHIVECYAIDNRNVVIARAKLNVPIGTNIEEE